MKTLTLVIIGLSCFTLSSLAQIQMESLDLENPQVTSTNKVHFFKTGPLMIVKIDSIEFKLDSISSNYVDPDWIQSITVLKDKNAKGKYGNEGERGVVIITLQKEHIEDFFERKIVDKPITIRTYN